MARQFALELEPEPVAVAVDTRPALRCVHCMERVDAAFGGLGRCLRDGPGRYLGALASCQYGKRALRMPGSGDGT